MRTKFLLSIITLLFAVVTNSSAQNPHDIPNDAFELVITSTPNYITKDNIGAILESDGTPVGCGGSNEYDVFGFINTGPNVTDFTIHVQNISPALILMVQVLDSNMNDIGCSLFSGSGTAPLNSISPNSTY